MNGWFVGLLGVALFGIMALMDGMPEATASHDPPEQTPPKVTATAANSSALPLRVPIEPFAEDGDEEERDDDDDEDEARESEDEDEILYEEFEQTVLPTPNRVRAQLRKLITDKGLKVKEAQALIGESPGPSWQKFMNGKYKDQSWAYSNDAFRKAAFFFWKEKRLGKSGKLVTMVRKNAKEALPNLSNATTDGKTYSTPAECRKSLVAIFKKYDLTHSKLAKMIGENPTMVGRFMSDSGEFGGSEKSCYHTLADFCEQIRIVTGAKKSRKRLAIEAEGRDIPYLGDDGKKRYLVVSGMSLYKARDDCGRSIVKCRRTG